MGWLGVLVLFLLPMLIISIAWACWPVRTAGRRIRVMGVLLAACAVLTLVLGQPYLIWIYFLAPAMAIAVVRLTLAVLAIRREESITSPRSKDPLI